MDKIYKPGECMKYMNVEMHPALLEAWYCADLTREMTAVGAKVTAAPELYDPALVMWSRKIPPVLTNKDGQVILTPPKQDCNQALYVTTADDVSEYVSKHTLPSHIKQIKDMVGKELTLVIFGVKSYFSSKRKTTNSNRMLMTDIELEMAKTDLLVTAGCDTAIADTPNDLALLIVHFTKAIAEAPHKLSKRALDEQAEFYMRGDNKNCVALVKDGQGVARAWQQMVSVLPGSSLETSRAICAQYNKPRDLYEALLEADSVSRLSDVCVPRTAVSGARARRLGPEFARRMHALFTATDGDILLD